MADMEVFASGREFLEYMKEKYTDYHGEWASRGSYAAPWPVRKLSISNEAGLLMVQVEDTTVEIEPPDAQGHMYWGNQGNINGYIDIDRMENVALTSWGLVFDYSGTEYRVQTNLGR